MHVRKYAKSFPGAYHVKNGGSGKVKMLHAPNLRKHGIRSGPILSALYLNTWLDRAPPMRRWLEQTARKRETFDSCQPIIPYLVVGLEGFPPILNMAGDRPFIGTFQRHVKSFFLHLSAQPTVRMDAFSEGSDWGVFSFRAECNTSILHHSFAVLLEFLRWRNRYLLSLSKCGILYKRVILTFESLVNYWILILKLFLIL